MLSESSGIPGNSTLFVGDLSCTCTESMLFELFSTYGVTLEARIIKTKKKNASLGYAFVTMGSNEVAAYAVQALHGSRLCGRDIRVDFASHVDERRHDLSGAGVDNYYQTHNNSNGHHSHNNLNQDNSVFFPQYEGGPINNEGNMNCGNSNVVNNNTPSPNSNNNAAPAHTNSVYVRFQYSNLGYPIRVDEETIRNWGENCVSDVSIRRITEEPVSIYSSVLM